MEKKKLLTTDESNEIVLQYIAFVRLMDKRVMKSKIINDWINSVKHGQYIAKNIDFKEFQEKNIIQMTPEIIKLRSDVLHFGLGNKEIIELFWGKEYNLNNTEIWK
jgi:hypothetical protein